MLHDKGGVGQKIRNFCERRIKKTKKRAALVDVRDVNEANWQFYFKGPLKPSNVYLKRRSSAHSAYLYLHLP